MLLFSLHREAPRSHTGDSSWHGKDNLFSTRTRKVHHRPLGLDVAEESPRFEMTPCGSRDVGFKYHGLQPNYL